MQLRPWALASVRPDPAPAGRASRSRRGVGLAAASACALALGAASVADAAEPANHGAVVVAVGAGANDAAAALARVVYRDAALRPTLDEATARVLAGEPAPEGASPALHELSDLRASIERAGSDVAERRLLAAIGTETHAAVIVPVSRADGAVHARALRVDGALFVGPVLTADVVTPADGKPSVVWPATAASSLRAAIGPLAPAPISAPARPAPDEHASRSTFSFSNPWLWAGLGAALAAGVTAFVLSRSTGGDSPTVHVGGSVPR